MWDKIVSHMGKGILKRGEEIHSNGYPPQQTRKKKHQ
jgi:hypothetical protein